MLYGILQKKRDLILKVATKHGIQNVRVLGSEARFEDGPTSDIHLLVDVEDGRSLFDLIRFKREMEELLHIQVDVVTENSIHWSIKQAVINKAIQI